MTNPARYDYSAVPSRPGGAWPGGARLAVMVCVGVESYRFGDGLTEDVLPGVPAPDVVNTAWRDYGNRVGAFRIFDMLASLQIPPTVLLNTDVYAEAPEVVAAARAAGAEIVGHGKSNSDILSGMDPAAEGTYLSDVAELIARHEGAPPGGWSSPWLTHTPHTLELLAATGYRYLLDLRLDDQPVWLRTDSGALLAIPYNAEINDSSTMIGKDVSADVFAAMITDEFGELHSAAENQPLVMSIVLHSFITGVPFRLAAVRRALTRIAGADDVWFTTPGQIHAGVTGAPDVFPAPTKQVQV
ncbi:polysaccharide deacetylase family protein [Mycolicibacterium sp. 018/SC-01/001]|uniref:polysaccharide deacetylase family protein n=1 Tax=Mycolicibacterium sp. 018/SC-01/001 TaxID=2592069 RepID=UPI00117F7784|nr:polysaccharide deacetylase family protein [Mycolicibacterium sp. 018/SC-01/001]TRW76966.1 polysaccharide deacetylase family protein [Mycolicibacterium sp. 018/SC-01/001]